MENIEYKGYTIKIWEDCDTCNPYNDWDMLGTMYHWHQRGFIGEDISHYDTSDIEDLVKETRQAGGIVLPVYLYEHGGQTINTTGFSCPWDSGQVGLYIVEGDKIRKEYSAKRISKKLREKVTSYLTGEIETIDNYLTGQVYGFSILDNQGDIIDSCGGFYGDYKGYCLEEAKSQIDCLKRQSLKEHIEKVKTFIKNNVPLNVRQNEFINA